MVLVRTYLLLLGFLVCFSSLLLLYVSDVFVGRYLCARVHVWLLEGKHGVGFLLLLWVLKMERGSRGLHKGTAFPAEPLLELIALFCVYLTFINSVTYTATEQKLSKANDR